MKNKRKNAVVLLSGGLDSATVLAMAKERGFLTYAVSFDYGQRHRLELDHARAVASSLGATKHRIVKLELSGGSALDDNIDVPKNRSTEEITFGIPITYVPARNTIFLSHALGYAETLGASDLFIGVSAIDYSGYPDCRPEYILAFETLANLATQVGVEKTSTFSIHAPLIKMTKAEIIKEGLRLGIDYSLTHSCYAPSSEGASCGECDSCQLRLKGFREAGATDPGTYLS
tara:strand:- start:500 stop:1192 length:693 start_codon:yes stop_codon:yes gene_type:complete